MGTIGRMIEEGEWPHTADLYAMWFGAIGSGYIMPEGSRCEPSLSGTNEVTIGDGSVVLGTSGKMNFSGTTLTPEAGSEFPRYDFIYLTESSGSLTVQVDKGSNLKLPSIGMPPAAKLVPIAVIYWDENQEITQLKDVRSVVDPQHAHCPGDGLLLDEYNARMNVDADETTVTTQNYHVEVGTVNIPSSIVHEGLWLENESVLNVDRGPGLGIKEVTDDEGNVVDELLFLDPAEIAAAGLTAGSGNLHAGLGDGISLVSGRVTVDAGDGVILRGTTPDRQIDLHHQEYGGLYFENDRVIIQADDFDGTGLSASNEVLNVREGYGVTIGSAVNLDAGQGLSAATQLNVDRETGGGIELDANDKLYGEVKSDIAGNGLSVFSGRVDVNAGEGITTATDSVMVDLAGALASVNGKIQIQAGSGVSFDADYDRLQVEPTQLDGIGLQASGSDLAMDLSGGLTVSADQVVPDTVECMTTESGELKVVPSALVDGDTLTVSEENIFLNDKPKFFELLKDVSFTLSSGTEKVITVPDEMLMVSINGEGQPETNHGEYEWYFQESSDSAKQEVVIEYPSGTYTEDINLRARIYHIKWETWME